MKNFSIGLFISIFVNWFIIFVIGVNDCLFLSKGNDYYHDGESDGSIVTGRYTADYLRCGNTAVSGCGTQRRFLSHRRIRRYLVLLLKAAEKHVTLVM